MIHDVLMVFHVSCLRILWISCGWIVSIVTAIELDFANDTIYFSADSNSLNISLTRLTLTRSLHRRIYSLKQLQGRIPSAGRRAAAHWRVPLSRPQDGARLRRVHGHHSRLLLPGHVAGTEAQMHCSRQFICTLFTHAHYIQRHDCT